MTLIVLLVLAATLGAGGYLFYAMLEKRLRGIDDGLNDFGATVEGSLEKLQLQVAIQPDRAIMPPPDFNGLVSVGGADCISKKATIRAGATFRITLGPVRSNYLRGKAMRILVYAEGHPSIEQRAEIHAVELNCCPQWHNSGCTPRSTETFSAPPGFAVAFEFHDGISSESLVTPLVVEIANPNPNNIVVLIEVYGEAMEINEVREEQRTKTEFDCFEAKGHRMVLLSPRHGRWLCDACGAEFQPYPKPRNDADRSRLKEIAEEDMDKCHMEGFSSQG